MNWFDQAYNDWQRLLANHSTTVHGKPNPAVTELLGNIDLLLKVSPQVKAERILRRCRLLILLIGIATLAYVMFSPRDHNSVALSARVTSVSFTLDSDGDAPVLKELSLKKLVAEPVDAFRSCDEKSSPLASSSLDHSGGTATILPKTSISPDAILLPPGTKVSIGLARRQQGLEVIFDYPTVSALRISGTASTTCSFDLVTHAKTLKLIVQPEGTELSEPTDGQIPINAVEFNLPRVDPGRSLSSITSGILSFGDIPDLRYSLDRGAHLSMDLRKGTLADLRVTGQELSLLLQGDAARIRLGYRDQSDITPTKLDWLRTKSRNIELWLGLMSFAAILFGIGLPQLKGGRS